MTTSAALNLARQRRDLLLQDDESHDPIGVLPGDLSSFDSTITAKVLGGMVAAEFGSYASVVRASNGGIMLAADSS